MKSIIVSAALVGAAVAAPTVSWSVPPIPTGVSLPLPPASGMELLGPSFC
jgi:hypothetical protein